MAMGAIRGSDGKMFTGCHELDLTDDPVTDLGEESINAEGWFTQ